MNHHHHHRDIRFIRHAPACPPGHLYGRTDADIDQIESATTDRLRHILSDCKVFYSSPAKRCVRTCQALFPNRSLPHLIESFQEQCFGDWEGRAYTALPDLGPLNGQELVQFAPPNGESFSDVCSRVQPVLLKLLQDETAQSMAVCAHAGVIRAVLAHAFDSPQAALRCEIDPLSVTHLRALPGAQFSVVCVNQTG